MTIAFVLPEAGVVEVLVYDVRGRRVKRLFAGSRERGPHTITWDGTNERANAVASGVYLVVVRAGGSSDHRSVVLLK